MEELEKSALPRWQKGAVHVGDKRRRLHWPLIAVLGTAALLVCQNI